MVEPPSCSIEFNRNRDAAAHAGTQAKEKTESKTVANSKHHEIGHNPGKQSQRTVLTAQQIVSKVKTPDHIQAGARNADCGNRLRVNGNDSNGSTLNLPRPEGRRFLDYAQRYSAHVSV